MEVERRREEVDGRMSCLQHRAAAWEGMDMVDEMRREEWETETRREEWETETEETSEQLQDSN